MSRKYRDPEAPEVLEAILARFRAMTREEWQEALSWRPEGAEETWRTAQICDEESAEAVRRGLDDVATGRTQPADEAFEEIRRELRIPRETT